MLKRNMTNQSTKKRKGQSTVEYILLVGAVLFAIIVFLQPGGLFQKSFNKALVLGTNGMENMANRLATSRKSR